MKKWLVAVSLGVCLVGYFIPYERSITFSETRVEKPRLIYQPLRHGTDFDIVFTHSIHLTDVTESYRALPTHELQLVAMQYTDVAIGMPGVAAEHQTLTYENGVYTLRYDDARLEDFTLHIGDVDYKLELHYGDEIIPLKETLTRGKSYVLQIQKVSLYQKMKGVALDE